ncbi:MAG: hypothetical protein KF861_05810, partial [Planctomycetaceae bacterium]|nr:hypothetical protein [Planctomycetaceae bacterium]
IASSRNPPDVLAIALPSPAIHVTQSSVSSSSVSLRSVSVVTLLSLGQMVVLFIHQLVLARFFGATEEMDAYLAAYVLPLVVGGILSTAVGTVVVTLFHELLAGQDVPSAESQLAQLGMMLLAMTAAIAGIIAFFADDLTSLLFRNFSIETAALTAHLLRILCWLIPLNTLIGFLFGVEHGRRHFVMPALSGMLGPALMILLFLFATDRSISALAWSVLWGTIAAVGMLLLRFPRWRTNATGQRTVWRRFGYLSLPLFLGAAYSRLDVFVDRVLADNLTTGTIAQMGYSWRIATAVITLATSGLSVVAFPSLARHAAVKDWNALRVDLNECWRFLTVVMLPVCGGIVVCGDTIIAALFEHGAFTAADTTAVARYLNLYAGMIVAAGIGEIAGRTFYASGNTWFPTLVGMGGFTLGMVLKFLLVEREGGEGLVAITSGYYLFNIVILLIGLRIKGVLTVDRHVAVTIFRSLAAAVVAIGVAEMTMAPDSPLRVLAGIVAAAAIYVVMLALLGEEFARRAFRMIDFRSRPDVPM